MPFMPDLTDPRYLDEIGWFLHHEAHGREKFGGSYDEERLAYSRLFLERVLAFCGQDEEWLRDKVVVSIGSGCTGDLATWPAAIKIAVDPLLYAYDKLGMLIPDVAGVSRTVSLSVGAQDIPLLDEFADLVLCQNALDHMLEPDAALGEIQRILKQGGLLYLSVDIGGKPTPDEPTIFSDESLSELVGRHFEIVKRKRHSQSHSSRRQHSVQILARNKESASGQLDRAKVLDAYLDRRERS